jgi:D-3-phosphoglycerate dehydrogenase / 2-oxoglutarate reductase
MSNVRRWQPTDWNQRGRIVVTGPRIDSNDPTMAALQKAGYEPSPVPVRDDAGLVSTALGDAEVVISGGTKLDGPIFKAMTRTRLLLRPYVGYDDIDVDAASEQGILVANIPDTFIEEVANQTLAFILALNRKVVPMDHYMRSGAWPVDRRGRAAAKPIRRLSSITLGLVGFGNIGRLVAERVRPFGTTMLAYDPFVAPEAGEPFGVRLVSLEELLRSSDMVSLHVFLSKETRGLISAERLARMKSDAYLVNTSRGPVVDEAALIATLQAGGIAGAALDVFEHEPLAADSPLLGMENVILSPHVASYSEEGDAGHRLRVAQIALQVARGGLPERKVVINKALYDEIAELPALRGIPRA